MDWVGVVELALLMAMSIFDVLKSLATIKIVSTNGLAVINCKGEIRLRSIDGGMRTSRKRCFCSGAQQEEGGDSTLVVVVVVVIGRSH